MSHTPRPTSVLDAGTVETRALAGIATVTFGHPRGNSMPGALLTRLAEAIALAGQDPAARVIVLRSQGNGPFCAGASFDELKAVGDKAAGKRFFSGFAKVILAMIRSPKPVVTRVQGRTAGGGVGLIAASDYALASASAAVKLSELAIGLGPFVVGPVIERKIGLAAFSALAVDADWRPAAWAHQHGLFAEVLETVDELDRRVDAFAAKLVERSPEAMRRLKEVFWEGTEGWPELLAARAEITGELVLTEYARRAIGS
jgi:methylglutaconyl-CoA hydratase